MAIDMIRRPDHQEVHDLAIIGCELSCVPLAEHPTLSYVYAFAALMEQKFHANRHKGNREGWMALDVHDIINKLEDEQVEVAHALHDWLQNPTPENARAVALECADVANYALELADRVGGLQTNE